MQSWLNSHSEQSRFFPKLLRFLEKYWRRLALSITREMRSPKRKAVGSNPAGEANKKALNLGLFYFPFAADRAANGCKLSSLAMCIHVRQQCYIWDAKKPYNRGLSLKL